MSGAFPEVVCGALGALAASVVRVPQEVLKQRVQADIYPNAFTGAAKLISTEGIGGFYKGYFATISRDVPSQIQTTRATSLPAVASLTLPSSLRACPTAAPRSRSKRTPTRPRASRSSCTHLPRRRQPLRWCHQLRLYRLPLHRVRHPRRCLRLRL